MALAGVANCLLAACALAAPGAVLAQSGSMAPIRSAANTSWSMPLARFEGEQLVGGIIFEIAQGVGEIVNRPVQQIPLPRKRVDGAALSGEIDLRCYLNPKWTDAASAFVWSDPLFEQTDVLFGNEGLPAPQAVSDIPYGSFVSAVLGYRYPALDAAFASGQLKREDTVDQDKVLLKLTAGRTPYGISNVLSFDWYRRTTPRHGLSDWRLLVGSASIHCAVPKASPLAAGPLIEALNTMKRSGRIEAILRNYR